MTLIFISIQLPDSEHLMARYQSHAQQSSFNTYRYINSQQPVSYRQPEAYPPSELVSPPPVSPPESVSPRPLHRVLSLPLKPTTRFQSVLNRFELGAGSSNATSITSHERTPRVRKLSTQPKDFPRIRETTVAELIELFDEGGTSSSGGIRSPGAVSISSFNAERRRLVGNEVYMRNFEKWKALERERFLESLEGLKGVKEVDEEHRLHRRASTALTGRRKSIQPEVPREEGFYNVPLRESTPPPKKILARAQTFSALTDTPAYASAAPTSSPIVRKSSVGSIRRIPTPYPHSPPSPPPIQTLSRRPSIPSAKGYKPLHLSHNYPQSATSSVHFSDDPVFSSNAPPLQQGRRSSTSRRQQEKAKYVLDMDQPRAWKFPRNIVVVKRKKDPVPAPMVESSGSESFQSFTRGIVTGPGHEWSSRRAGLRHVDPELLSRDSYEELQRSRAGTVNTLGSDRLSIRPLESDIGLSDSTSPAFLPPGEVYEGEGESDNLTVSKPNSARGVSPRASVEFSGRGVLQRFGSGSFGSSVRGREVARGELTRMGSVTGGVYGQIFTPGSLATNTSSGSSAPAGGQVRRFRSVREGMAPGPLDPSRH